jgi:hypothetical protein
MNVFRLRQRQRCRMRETEPFDSERARSGLTAITGPSPARPPGGRQGSGDFMTRFSLQTLGFPDIHGDGRPIKLNLRKGLALLIGKSIDSADEGALPAGLEPGSTG